MQEQDVRKKKARKQSLGEGEAGEVLYLQCNFHFGSLQGRNQGLKEQTVTFLGFTLRELNSKLYEKKC